MKRRGSTENINNNEIIRSLYTFLKEIPFFKLNFPDSFQLHSFLTKSKDCFIYNHYSLGDIVFHYGKKS